MAERGAGGKILSLTVKRAKRVQEKMMQRLGKSDQTKDDVFEDFVNNFNRQSASASKLQKELTKFMNAIRVLNQCNRSLGDTLKELYDPGWAGQDKYGDLLQTKLLLWEDQIRSLQSKMVEPMNNYISKFPEVKNRIQKRERKVVDYDLRRRELEALKTKQKVTDQKLQQAEEGYSQAKQFYDEIADELYEELPTFFDSRIQFYASIFQSIAATEARFHSEIAKVDEEFAGLMDGLASEAATAIHTTKKERALDSIPKLMSRPGEDSDSDGEYPPPVATPTSLSHNNISDHSNDKEDSNELASPDTTPTRTTPSDKPLDPVSPSSSFGDGGSLKRQPPSKPIRSPILAEPPAGVAMGDDAGSQPQMSDETASQNSSTIATPSKPLPRELSEADLAELDAFIEKTDTTTTPPSSSSVPPVSSISSTLEQGEDGGGSTLEQGEDGGGSTLEQGEDGGGSSLPASPQNASQQNDIVLYKVLATHPYSGEDEDELSFEKGNVIEVVPYEDPEDEEEGWCTGRIEGTYRKGIFPANFTKKLDV